MRIAHISDLHVLALAGAGPLRFLNKRVSGYANLRLKRKHVHRREIVRLVAERLASARVDHVVITGDVSNLALEPEFAAVRHILEDVLQMPPSAVTLVPGNHDVYTRGAESKRRFASYFEPYIRSDMPHERTDQPGGMFPIVQLRGPVAIIGLSTALARPMFVASGKLGPTQLEALRKILASSEVKARTPVILLHHPIHNPTGWLKVHKEGLVDAEQLQQLLLPLDRGLVLHGHLHRRIHRTLSTTRGHLDVIGATSASLVHESPARMAGYNEYEIDETGAIARLTAFVYTDLHRGFVETTLPEGLATDHK
jgi:3',5'-cyclic AMP phosphodiesterase CpdA